MCTLSIIPIRDGAGFRVVTNRDEQRTRPKAIPPRAHVSGGRQWLWPEDGLAGGAWIGASADGLALSILNLNLTPRPGLPPRDELVSRGHLIPSLSECGTSEEAMLLISRMSLARFAPFRLVAADFAEVGVARWDRERLTIERRPLGPMCLVSSGLGDHLVEPRLALFEDFLTAYGATARMQDQFHRHTWPGRAEISVMMSRPDARTVSTTAVEIVRDPAVAVSMRYTADHESALVGLPAVSALTAEVRPRVAAAAGQVR